MMNLQVWVAHAEGFDPVVGTKIYDSGYPEELQLIKSPVLEQELNSAGTLTYTVAPIPDDNPALFIPKMSSIIYVRRDGDVIWHGRPVSEDVDINGVRTVTVEGAMAFLNDIVVRPYNEPDRDIQYMFSRIMGTYSRLCSEWRMIHLGQILMTDDTASKLIGGTTETSTPVVRSDLEAVVDAVINGDYGVWPECERLLTEAGYDYGIVQENVSRVLRGESIQWPDGATTVSVETSQVRKEYKKEMPGSVLSELFELFVNEYGGYLRLRYDEDTNREMGWAPWIPYLDWIVDYDIASSYGITFGQNLLDYQESLDATDIFTQVVPYGKAKGSIKTEDGQEVYPGLVIVDPETGEERSETFGKLTLVDGVAGYSYDDYTGENSRTFSVPDEEGINQYGVIERALEYSDIEDVDLLRNAAVQDAAGGYQMGGTIDITAIDLALFYEGSVYIEVGFNVPVVSRPHVLNMSMQCSAITYDFEMPENTTYTFGTDNESLTSGVVSGNVTNGNAVVHGGGSRMNTGGGMTDTIRANQGFFQYLEAHTVKVEDITAATGYIGELVSGSITADILSANVAYIDSLTAEDITAETIVAAQGYIDTLIANSITAQNLTAASAYITELTTDVVQSRVVSAESLKAHVATVDELSAGTASIWSLYAKTADIESAYIDKANIANLFADNATLTTFVADNATVTDATLKLLRTDAANVTSAAISKLFGDTGLINNLVVSQSLDVTGRLGAIELDADNIVAGTLTTDRLLIKGDDSLYYALNVNAMGQAAVSQLTPAQVEEIKNGLHGKSIVAHSITADQIAANTITANEIVTGTITANEIAGNTITGAKLVGTDLSALKGSIGGMVLNSNSMHTTGKTTASSTTSGFYMNSSGDFSIGDADEYIKFINGALSMKIASFDSILAGSTGLSSEINSRISASATSITSTVAQTYLTKTDAQNTYATSTTLTQTANGLTATIQNLNAANLIPNSHKTSFIHGWVAYNASTEANIEFNGARTCKIKNVSSGWAGFGTPLMNSSTIAGRQVTFAFYYTGDTGIDLYLYLYVYPRNYAHDMSYLAAQDNWYNTRVYTFNINQSGTTYYGTFTVPTSFVYTGDNNEKYLTEPGYVVRFGVFTNGAVTLVQPSSLRLYFGDSQKGWTLSPWDDIDSKNTNYASLTKDGLLVGDLHNSALAEGSLAKNVLISPDNIQFRNGVVTLGTIAPDKIQLAQNSATATIEMCNAAVTIGVGSYKIDNTTADRLGIISKQRDILIRATDASRQVHIYGSDNGSATSASTAATRIRAGSGKITLDVGHDANYNWGPYTEGSNSYGSSIELNSSGFIFKAPGKFYRMTPDNLDYTLCTKMLDYSTQSGWYIFGFGHSNAAGTSQTYKWVRAYCRLNLGVLTSDSFWGNVNGWYYINLPNVEIPMETGKYFTTKPHVQCTVEAPASLWGAECYYVYGGTATANPYLSISIYSPRNTSLGSDPTWVHVFVEGAVT